MSASLLVAIRPKTLVASLSPIAVATALAYRDFQAIPMWVVVVAFMCALFLQIATNLINDAEDYIRGADDEHRLGPTRVTSTGMMDSSQVKRWGFLFLGLAFLFGIPLMIRGGISISVLGLLSVVASYGYTAGPFPLAYKGLGEAFVMIFFGLIAVCGLYHLLGLEGANFNSIVASIQVGALAVGLIAINNYRDIVGDKKVNKNTLAVRFGEGFGRKEIQFFLFLPFVMGLYWYQSSPKAATFPLLSLPLALFIATKIAQSKPSKELNKFLALTALLQMVFSALLVVGLLT